MASISQESANPCVTYHPRNTTTGQHNCNDKGKVWEYATIHLNHFYIGISIFRVGLFVIIIARIHHIRTLAVTTFWPLSGHTLIKCRDKGPWRYRIFVYWLWSVKNIQVLFKVTKEVGVILWSIANHETSEMYTIYSLEGSYASYKSECDNCDDGWTSEWYHRNKHLKMNNRSAVGSPVFDPPWK